MPTVLVVTDKISRDAAKKIHRALAPLLPDICVELISDALLDLCRCFPVTQSDSIFHKWEDICEIILSQWTFPNGLLLSAGDMGQAGTQWITL